MTTAERTYVALGFALIVIQLSLIRKSLKDNQYTTNRKLDHIMAEVRIEQSVLEDIATDVSDTADLLQGVLDSDTPLEEADVTSLNAAVEKLRGVGVKVPTDGGDTGEGE